jgi:hypothetical protein
LKDRKSQNSTSQPTKRRNVGRRLGERARELGELGGDAIRQPGSLPNRAHGWFRTWFAKVWKVRGGGLYACGYAITFVVLEARSIGEELLSSNGVLDFLTNQLLEFFFRFLSESLINMIHALIWPIEVLKFRPPLGVIAFGLAYLAFEVLLRARIEQWLEPDMVETVD